MKVDTNAAKEAIAKRNMKLSVYKRREVVVNIDQGIKFVCHTIGPSSYTPLIKEQIRKIMSGSEHGKILLRELAQLPIKPDIVEYSTSHVARYKDEIVVLHNAITPQGRGLARFETSKGRKSRSSFYPYMVLAHELFHVGQYQRAKFFEPYCNWICDWTGGPWKLGSKAYENQTVRYTNQIRIDHNHGRIRTHYHGFGGPQIDSYKEAKARTTKP